jgi:heme exporter protein B
MKLWWIIQKDLVCEYRTRQAWPRMLLLGFVVAFLLSYQLALSPSQLQHAAASLCWLTICFAAVLTLGQSIALERDDGCWEGLLLYPVTPQAVYLAKLAVNVVILGALQLVVVPLFAMVGDTQWLAHPGKLLLVSVLGNLGVASVGTLLGAMSAGMRQSQSLLALLLLPLLVPVILGASEATRLIGKSQAVSAAWHDWVQLLGAFTIVYITAGWVLFEFITED